MQSMICKLSVVATVVFLGAYGPESLAQATSAAKSACMTAVNSRYGGRVKNLNVVHSEFSQAASEVIVEADGERWRCLSSNDGEVEELRLQHGKSSASRGSDWDRGCSDAKVGSYDRSRHNDAYEEGWQACKQGGGNAGSGGHESPLSRDVTGLVGNKRDDGEDKLARLGYHKVEGDKSHGSTVGLWWNGGSRECLRVESKNGRIRSIERAGRSECD